jgi:hypothetical protein
MTPARARDRRTKNPVDFISKNSCKKNDYFAH